VIDILRHQCRVVTEEDARRVFEAIDRDFKWHGWLLALYGSTVIGKGQDVDLIAVPWRPHASVSGAIADLLLRLKAEQCGEVYRGEMETESYCFKTRDGILIDLQFRPSRHSISSNPVSGPGFVSS